MTRVALERRQRASARGRELDMSERDDSTISGGDALPSGADLRSGKAICPIRRGILGGERKNGLCEASDVPNGDYALAVACNVMGVERIGRYSMNLARCLCGWGSGAPKIEELEPAVRDTGEKELRVVGKPCERGDNLCRSVLTNDAAIASRTRSVTTRSVFGGHGVEREGRKGGVYVPDEEAGVVAHLVKAYSEMAGVIWRECKGVAGATVTRWQRDHSTAAAGVFRCVETQEIHTAVTEANGNEIV